MIPIMRALLESALKMETRTMGTGLIKNYKSTYFYIGFLLQAFIFVAAFMTGPRAFADSRVYAYRLYNRINGVPPSSNKLQEVAQLIDAGKFQDAAMSAINDPEGHFYNITLKNFFAKWSNKDESPRQSLNDYIATAIGMVRDDIPFNQILSEDILYTAEVGVPYSKSDNKLYETIESRNLNLFTALKKGTQSSGNGLPAEAIAGVFSTRGFAEAHYSAGTNRRAFEFTMKTFLCRSMESLKDTSRPHVRIRRDVARAPGGAPAKFLNECAGCHAGMDGFGGAFAYYDFDLTQKSIVYTQGRVMEKFNRNAFEFPEGYVTTDASWINLWTEGLNRTIGWNGPTSGIGAKSFGEMVSATDAFPRCMAQKAVEMMCARDYPSSEAIPAPDKDAIEAIATSFKSNFNMKDTFARAAVYCSK